ncbi:hypothetical protein LTS18_012290, partial [Coniosporium uncinatum]
PLVNFSPFFDGFEAHKQAVAEQLDDAFRNVGFVYLMGHEVPQGKVDECFRWPERPEETELLAPHPPGGAHHRGYSGLGEEKVSQNVFDKEQITELRQVPDVKESFESGNVHDKAQPNIWVPEDKLPGFQTFMQCFFLDCAGLVHQVLRALAIALSLPEKLLSDTHSQDLYQLRLLHYPSVPASVLHQGEKSRMGAYSDFGTLTLLFQDVVGGLQVEDPQQTVVFRSAHPVEGAVLVNIGGLMMRWSNDRWKSTVHQVSAPPVSEEESQEIGEDMCADRHSIHFFATADHDALIDALPGTWSDENTKKYEAVTTRGYVRMRMEATY